ncbi:MAG: hypothetical protein VX899_23785 [Myxococcota bacterium]|nr:hypothetical protein [Myxococcota bacterium]
MDKLRALSGPERLWRHAAAPGAPFALSVILKGPLDTTGLEHALQQAARANPGARAILHRGLFGPSWRVGPLPTLQALRAQPLPGEVGPWLPEAPFQLSFGPDTLVFSAHHALMDGRGLWHLVQETFRAWRGEPLLGGDDSIDDRRLLGPGLPLPPEAEFVAATGHHNGDLTPVWDHRRIEGRWSQLLSRVALSITRTARKRAPAAAVRLDIPVDLRQGLLSTANLTGIASITPPLEVDLDTITSQVTQVLQEDQALSWLKVSQRLRALPGPLLPPLIRHKTQQCLRRQRFGNTAVISNLGRVSLTELQGPGFACSRAFWLPPCGPTTTAFLGLLGTPEALELSCVMPRGLADQGRLASLLDGIVTDLRAPPP